VGGHATVDSAIVVALVLKLYSPANGSVRAVEASLPAEARAALAAQLSELLAALHRVPPAVVPGWYPDASYLGHLPGPARRARSMAADRHDRLRADHALSARVRVRHSRRLLHRR
jgi:aminoglycoside phosphotransferase (APT) family kinase protein